MSLDISAAKLLIPSTYIQQAEDAFKCRQNKIKLLFEQRKCPEQGWDESTIELLLNHLSLMDSNNFPGNCGVGEREARFASELVARRHYRFGHGIGRSGDIAEVQPKAAGSSLMNKLTNEMLLHILKLSGVTSVKSCVLIPVATGMSLVLCLLSLRQGRSKAKYVIWSRIDQKSCFKCMLTAGFEPVIVDTVLVRDELQTNLDVIENKIIELGSENIVCVLTTTSCFAPRAPDKLEEVAELCKKYEIPHIVNNAYGVQSSKCMHLIQQAFRVGRVDAFVQSTDKNFMVPVGGSIIASFDTKVIEKISKLYPGRASGTPSMDVFVTLLTLGVTGYKRLLNERKENFQLLKTELSKLADKHGERVLETKNNQISLGMSLNCLPLLEKETITFIGSMLFMRGVSGTRVMFPKDFKSVGGYSFNGWGSHHPEYPCAYLTAAASIGMSKDSVSLFIQRLDKVLNKIKQQKCSSDNSGKVL